ncbi:MAG: hypothetical protein P1V97_18340 [Planctomycetota bacterium]|nr:hypothetical protein [Planctomycetota bacterium]
MNPKLAMWSHLAVMYVVVAAIAIKSSEEPGICRLPPPRKIGFERKQAFMTADENVGPWTNSSEGRHSWIAAESQEQPKAENHLEFWRCLQVERPFEYAVESRPSRIETLALAFAKSDRCVQPP